MNRIAVAKHEDKIRLYLELPVGGEDKTLVRVHDVDMPLVHALALAAGILNEATALLRGLRLPNPLTDEQRAKLAADRRASLERMAKGSERKAELLKLGDHDRAELRRLLAEADASATVADIGRASSGQVLSDGEQGSEGPAKEEHAPELGELRRDGTDQVEQPTDDRGDDGNGHVHSDTSNEKVAD